VIDINSADLGVAAVSVSVSKSHVEIDQPIDGVVMDVISEIAPLAEETETTSGNMIPTVEKATAQSMENISNDNMATKKLCQSSSSQQSNEDHRKRDLSTVEEKIVQSVSRRAFGNSSMDIETTERATRNENVAVCVENDNSGIKSKNERPNSRECIEKLLTQNFDRVSAPCVITITKYILNILSDPSEPKYRTINTTNKAFQEKVLNAVYMCIYMYIYVYVYIYVYEYIYIYI
jgi:hypothetical protein